MPARSKAQQRLMGMAYAVKKGEMPRSEASEEVLDLADSMTLKQLKDYAKTSHKNLPDKVDEYSLGSKYLGTYQWFTQAGQAEMQKIAMRNDQKDPIVQKFIDYVDDEEEIQEGDYGAAIAASPSNVPGMGNAAPPQIDQFGSGDVYSQDDDEEDKGIMSFKSYKKWLKNRKK